MKDGLESKYFGLYHNGITIAAKTLKKTGDSIVIENFQIVNGCQTSHIIAENRKLLPHDKIEQMFIPYHILILFKLMVARNLSIKTDKNTMTNIARNSMKHCKTINAMNTLLSHAKL